MSMVRRISHGSRHPDSGVEWLKSLLSAGFFCVRFGDRQKTMNATSTYRFFQRQVSAADLTNPLFADVMDVWQGLRGDAVAPPWRVADMLCYPSVVIPFISVVDMIAPGQFRYRYWGTGHVDVKGYDYTGCTPLDHEPPEYGRMINDEYQAVSDCAQPMAFVHDIHPGLGQTSKHQETLRLPLANDGKVISGVISFADWRTNAGQWTEMFDILADTPANANAF